MSNSIALPRWLVGLLFVLVSALLPRTASEFTAIGAGTYTGDFDVPGSTVVGVLHLAGPEKHWGVPEYHETAPGSSNAARGADDVARVFHHTFDDAVESIRHTGLRPGSYATPTGGLSPLQAQIELALPPNGARNAVLSIDVQGLRSAGYQIPEGRRVPGQFGLPGGGYEMQFPYAIPPEFITVVQP